MNILPCELVDKILSYLDGLSLAKSACVCRTWRELHKQNHYNSQWKRVCFRELLPEELSDITGYSWSKFEKNLDGLLNVKLNWKEVYKECYRSWFIGKWPSLGTELKGHLGEVYDAKFSGDRVITCGKDSTVRIWDSWTGNCIQILQNHWGDVTCLALRRKSGVLSHDDYPHDLIISGSDDFTVCVWDIQTGQCFKQLRQSSKVNSVAVSGNIIVAGSANDIAEVWDISKDNPREPLCSVHTDDWITFVGLWDDFFVTVTDKNKVDFWSLAGENISSVIHHTGMNVTSAALRGDRTVTLSYDGELSVWQHRVVNGEIDFSILRCYSIIASGGTLEDTCMAIYGNLVAIGTKHGMINVYHLEKDWDKQFQQIHTVIHSCQLTRINSIDVSDDGTGPCVLSAGQDGVVRVERWFPWPSSQ